MNTEVTLKPRVSEKAYGLSARNEGKPDARNTYVFDVDGSLNKHTVARAIESQYGVSVEKVNVTNLKGKSKRTVRKGGRPVAGRTSDVKKAYVTLKAGESLPIFAAIDQANAEQEEAQEKLTKVAEKAAAKEAKKTAKEEKGDK
jgi:large subunit ribosomal protein L23